MSELRDGVATRGDIVALRSDIRALVRDLTIRMGGMAVVAVVILVCVRFFGGEP